MACILPPLADLSLWLAGRPWDEVIGARTCCTACPLARWLQDVLPARAVIVDEEGICIVWMQQAWERVSTPPTYRRFIETIDYAAETPQRDVHVLEVRHALKQITREYGEEVYDQTDQ